MHMSRLFYLSFSGRVSSEAKEKHMLSGHLSLSLTTMRSWRCAFVVATLVVLLAACGSSTSGSGGTTPTTSAAQNTTPTSSSGYGGWQTHKRHEAPAPPPSPLHPHNTHPP